ncbi:MAG TPA: hypothetical protein VGX78_03100, partial [Pirellulales bacterium]|nr:hypothetical protein [Pirellulales bacterium]
MGRDCRRFYAPLAVLPLAVAAFLFPPPVADLFLVPLASLDAQPDDDTADDEGVEEDWDDEMIDDDVVGEFLIDDDVILQPPPQAQVEQIERGLRLRVRAELEFVRMTCAPTDAQILELNHAGDQFVADVVAGIRTNPPRRIEPSVMFADRASPCLCDLQPVIHALLDTARRVKYLDELSRTDELIRQAHILDRVATLDETYLLTAEQRDELGRILDARWANPNRSEVVGAHHVNSPVDANAWFVHQLTPLPE